MPYKTTSDLPEGVKNALPARAQRIYMATHNSVMKGGGDEEKSAKIAWGSVKQKFKKKGDKWVAKAQGMNPTAPIAALRQLYEAHWTFTGDQQYRDPILDLLAQAEGDPTQVDVLTKLQDLQVPAVGITQRVYDTYGYSGRNTHDFPGSLDHHIRMVCAAVHEEGEEYLGRWGYCLAVYPDHVVTCWSGPSDCECDDDVPEYWSIDYTVEANKVVLGDAKPVEVLTIVVPAEAVAGDGEGDMTGAEAGGETGQATKTDSGKSFGKSAYLIVPDADKPSTWKIRIEETPGNVTVPQLGRAYAALTKGFRGNKVSASSDEKSAALGKLKGLYKSHKAEWPGDKQEDADAPSARPLVLQMDPTVLERLVGQAKEEVREQIRADFPKLYQGTANLDLQWHEDPEWLTQGEAPPGGPEDLVQTFTMEILQKEVDETTGVMKIKGVATRGNVVNKMGEVYPTQVWLDNLPFLQQMAAEGSALGEADHPNGPPSLDRTCLMFDKYTMLGDDLQFEGRVLPIDPSGKNLQCLLQNGARVDISSRGKGAKVKGAWVNPSTGERHQDVMVVQRGFKARAFDAVVNGASPGSTITSHEMAQQANLTADEEIDMELGALTQQVEQLAASQVAAAAAQTAMMEAITKIANAQPAPAPEPAPAPAPVATQTQGMLSEAGVQQFNQFAGMLAEIGPIVLERKRQALLQVAAGEHQMPQQWLNAYRTHLEMCAATSVAELETASQSILPSLLALYEKRPQAANGVGWKTQQDAGARPGPKTPREMIEFMVSEDWAGGKALTDEDPYGAGFWVKTDAEGNQIQAPDHIRTPRRQMRKILQNIAEHVDGSWNGKLAMQSFVNLFQGHSPQQVQENWMDQACSECTTAVGAGGAPASAIFIFPLVRKVFPQLIAQELASVQPMDRPNGKIFYLTAYRISTGVNSVDEAGTTIANRMATNRSESFSSSYSNDPGECNVSNCIQLRLAAVSVDAQTKKLHSEWSIEELQDLRAYHNLDVAAELVSNLSREIALEWNQIVLQELLDNATAGNRIFATGNAVGYTQKEWDEYITRYIDAASTDIFKKRNGGATHLIAGPDAWLKLGAAFRTGVQMAGMPNPEMYPGLILSPWMAGSTATLKTYQTNFWSGVNANKILLVRRGADWSDTPYVWAPYVDYVSPVLTMPDTLTQKQGVMSRAAHKVVVSDASSTITITSGTGTPL